MTEVWGIDELVRSVLKEFPKEYRPEIQEIFRSDLVQHAKLTLGEIEVSIWYCPDSELFGGKPVEVTVQWKAGKANISAWDYTTPDEAGSTVAGLVVLARRFLKTLKGGDLHV